MLGNYSNFPLPLLSSGSYFVEIIMQNLISTELICARARLWITASGNRNFPLEFAPAIGEATPATLIILPFLCRLHAQPFESLLYLPCTYWRSWSQLERARIRLKVRSLFHDPSRNRRSRNRRNRKVLRIRSKGQRMRRRQWREGRSAIKCG